MRRLGVVGLSLFGMVLLSSAAGAEAERAVAGVVRDAGGSAVAGIEVVLEIGRVHLPLAEDLDRWESVRTDRTTSDPDGRFRFADVPEGASLLVWAKNESAFASAAATADVTLTLAPLGSVHGKVTGKPALLKGLRAIVRGGNGLAHAEGKVDADSGRFEVAGVVPGAGSLHLYRGNFEVARVPVEVAAGEPTKVKAVRVAEGFPPVSDPLVDVLKVKLVDPEGRPVPGVQLIWSSQWMDGGMDSDPEGIVRLAGGGVAIGGPPYRLRIATLRKGELAFQGVLKGERGGGATVELQPLFEVTGKVTLGGKAVDLYRLSAVTDGKTPRVRPATVENGRYSVHLPPGGCRIVIATVDGVLRETTLEVGPSDSPQTCDVALP